MRVNLMYENKSFAQKTEFSDEENAVISDLEFDNILDIMASDDKRIRNVCLSSLLEPLQTEEEITYRQEILKDCIAFPEAVTKMYNICHDAKESRKGHYYMLSSRWISSVFSSAVDILLNYMTYLQELKDFSSENKGKFKSEGFKNFFDVIEEKLSNEYISDTKGLLTKLRKSSETLICAGFGNYLQGIDYTLKEKKESDFSLKWLLAPSYTLPERDDLGAEDLASRRNRAISKSAESLVHASEHIENFFEELQNELAFYLGGINLYRFAEKHEFSLCFPSVTANSRRYWEELCDLSLNIASKKNSTGNTLASENKRVYIITGANNGGKTTFLRSIGQAQLMAQSGLFVSAAAFEFPIKRMVYTHFKKEEDSNMKSGKLEEELSRMSSLTDKLHPNTTVLLNESLSSTNEREGSEILTQITRAFAENGVEVFSVTHLLTYACCFENCNYAQFLRAERLENGERTFKLIPCKPCSTAFGEDIYLKVFGN